MYGLGFGRSSTFCSEMEFGWDLEKLKVLTRDGVGETWKKMNTYIFSWETWSREKKHCVFSFMTGAGEKVNTFFLMELVGLGKIETLSLMDWGLRQMPNYFFLMELVETWEKLRVLLFMELAWTWEKFKYISSIYMWDLEKNSTRR